MSQDETRPWPPLVTAANLPRRIVWRDVAATLLLWALFLYVVGSSLDVAGQAVDMLSGRTVEAVDPVLGDFLDRMSRRFGMVFLLVAILALTTLRSIRIHDRALGRSPPEPVADSDLAADLGVDLAGLAALRARRVVTLDVDEQGRVL